MKRFRPPGYASGEEDERLREVFVIFQHKPEDEHARREYQPPLETVDR